MSEQALKYLQQDEIGKVIAKGLASVYTKKPARPIKYLAQWLKSYSSTKSQLSSTTAHQKTKSQFLSLFQQTQNIQHLRHQQQQIKHKQFQDKINYFKKMLVNYEYHQQLLLEVLPQFVEQCTNVNGVYIGQLNYPKKNVTEEDVDQNAHLDMSVEKVINYIGSSLSHKGLMRGKVLRLNQGITGRVFAMAEGEGDKGETVVGEDGQQFTKQKQQKQKYLYIPNVVKNQSMHYFKIPKLGAYLAVPLIYKSYLSQKTFDETLSQRKKQLQQLSQFTKKHSQQLQQLTTAKNQLQKRITDLKQKHAQQSQIQHLNTELAQLQKKINDKTLQRYQQQQLKPNHNKRSYVFCVDNLGKDEEIDGGDIKIICQLVEYFVSCWENKEKELLFRDVGMQVGYLGALSALPEQIKGQLEKSRQLDEQTTKSLQQIQDQFLRNYKTQQQQFTQLRTHIKNTQLFLTSFLNIKNFRILKYKEVLQNILYFLQETKDRINTPRKASINWKQIKDTHINKDVFNSILNYVVQGPKDKAYKFYMKTPLLLETFEKFNEEEIWQYNVGLGAIVYFVKKALKHRISNVGLRKKQRQAQRKQRQALIEQNAKIDIQRQQQLKVHKDTLPNDQVQGFKQEQWIQKFDKQHPKHEVPAEVIDDIDNDM